MSLPTQLDPLAQQLNKDNPRVLVLVGTGISAGATSAAQTTWQGLLKHGIKHLVDTEVFTERRGLELSSALDSAFTPFKLEIVLRLAEQVENVLSVPDSTALARWLEAAFRGLKALSGKTRTLDGLRELWEAGALLATTNYDSLLSDVTGAPPVTWEEHAIFLQVMNRLRPGILHLHGHWLRPNSVVLGRSSYGRVVKDELFQSAFKALWMERSWLYVGCGDGLDDPNLGTLLEWGRSWGEGQLRHYFLGRTDTATALSQRTDKHSNLEIAGYADHSELPDILRSLLPVAHCQPFVSVDSEFYLFRAPGSDLTVPFPSRDEYLRGDVPRLACEAEVCARLNQHGWAFVLDVASVGKTTLALRVAMSLEYCADRSFYLDLARDFDSTDLTAVIRRLSRAKCLLILDNVHHQPELGRQLWDTWRLDPHQSKLLLIATRIERAVTTAPAQDLGFYENHSTNPAVEVCPAPEDLVNIVRYLYRRVAGSGAKPLATPPPTVLQAWYRDYGSALGAFCVAVLGRFHEFQRDHWDLPFAAAAEWVREKWLSHLDPESLQNALCLAVFGSQELELEVQKEALPYPGSIHKLLNLGLVSMRSYGLWNQYQRLNFREPGWGKLILAAQVSHVDEDAILFKAAASHPYMALIVGSRLRQTKSLERLTGLWNHIAANLEKLGRLISETRLDYSANLISAAKTAGHASVAWYLWEALGREPEKFAARAWETSLDKVGSFLETAKRQGRDTKPLWEALEREPEKLAKWACERPLDEAGSFLETAKRQGRDTKPLWEALERKPEKLAARAWETPLENVGSFLETAKRQERETKPLWEALEREPEKLAVRAWETSLEHVASFLSVAQRQGRDMSLLWDALEREPEKFAARAWKMSPDKVAALLSVAKDQGRDPRKFCGALESEPGRLSAVCKNASVMELAAFCRQAPEALSRIALADIQPTHWDTIPHSEPFIGATWVAYGCEKAGRQDLKSAIITKLLRRANPKDFPPQVAAFANVAWLLNNIPAETRILVASFLASICTSKWLGAQYTMAACGRLADGLGLLALHQPTSMRQRFQNRSLDIRLQKEFFNFNIASRREQADIIRLLGVASLCETQGKREWLNDLPWDSLSTLAVEEIPHRSSAEKIERVQFQLWLGLRLVASLMGKPLPMAADLIRQTIDLWRVNLVESSTDQKSVEYRVNRNMVEWLEKCFRANGLLPAGLVSVATIEKTAGVF